MYLLIRATGGIRLTASGFGDRSTAGGGRGGAPRRARSRATRRSRQRQIRRHFRGRAGGAALAQSQDFFQGHCKFYFYFLFIFPWQKFAKTVTVEGGGETAYVRSRGCVRGWAALRTLGGHLAKRSALALRRKEGK